MEIASGQKFVRDKNIFIIIADRGDDILPTTNNRLREFILSGIPDGQIIIANEQLSGR